jgi:hypothetical protein
MRVNFAEVAELAYAQVSEACAARLEGSNPSFRTKIPYCLTVGNFFIGETMRLLDIPLGIETVGGDLPQPFHTAAAESGRFALIFFCLVKAFHLDIDIPCPYIRDCYVLL